MVLNNFISIFCFKKLIFVLLWNSCSKTANTKVKRLFIIFLRRIILKKIIGLLGMITVLSFGHGLFVSAEETTVIPEKTLDTFLKQSGAPKELLLRWEYDQKLDLYQKGQEGEIEFDTTKEVEFVETEKKSKGSSGTELIEVPDNKDGASGMGTISSRRLQVSHDIWSMYSKNVKYKSVYANYRWTTPKYGGTQNDKLAIAVPSGWSIKAKSYKCKEFQSGTNKEWLYKASCEGAPFDLDFYGAVWSLSRTDYVYHKGWASLDMKRTSKNAQLKVLSKYVEDTGGSKTWSVGWGPMSVSINGDKKDNRVAWDTGFKY